MKSADNIFVAISICVLLLLIAGCSRAEETDSGATEIAIDRVCVVEAAHLYADPELTNPLSPRMLGYWDFVMFIEADEDGKAERILVDGFDPWWVSTEEIRPLYRVTEQTEFLIPKLAISEDGGEPIEHMGLLDYLEPGELLAISVQPESPVDGYLMAETEDFHLGFILECAVEPVGNPGK